MPWILKNALFIKNWLHFYRTGSLNLELRNGLKVELPNRHDLPMLHEVMSQKVYGDLSKLPVNATILDLGANLGSFALLALKALPLAKVYAYEGAAHTAAVLKRNIEQNGFSGRGFARHLAVADKPGKAKFVTTGTGNTGHNYLSDAYVSADGKKRGWYEDEKEEEVECVSLDQILEETGVCDFVKMDIEGAEYKVIYASKLLRQRVKKIAMEYHGTQENVAQLRAHLSSLGYTIADNTPGFIYAS